MLPSLGPRPAHNAESPSRGPVVPRTLRLAEMTMGPGSCLCPARAALPVPLGPPLAQVACPSPFPEPRGAGVPGGTRSRWRLSPRVCKLGGDRRAGLVYGVSGNGAPVGIWIGYDQPWDGSRGPSLGPGGLEPSVWPMLHPTSSPCKSAAGSLRMPQGPPPGSIHLGPCGWPGRRTLAFCQKCWS